MSDYHPTFLHSDDEPPSDVTDSLAQLIDASKEASPEFADNLQLLLDSNEFKQGLLNPTSMHAVITLIKEYSSRGELNKLNQLMFAPQVPDEYDKQVFRWSHETYYQEDASSLAKIFKDSDNSQFVMLASGMYAGKSTLAAMVRREYGEEHVVCFVPDFMNEDEVTVRGGVDENGRYKTIPAHRLSKENFTTALDNFLKQAGVQSVKPVVYFEELSFASAEDVEFYLSEARQRNVHILIANLDKNYLTQELEGFEAVKRFLAQELVLHQCKSFVREETDMENPTPSGTLTRRFLRLSNGLVIADLGFADTIIPKANPRVFYLPSTEVTHLMIQLRNIAPRLFSNILNPSYTDQQDRIKMKQHLTGTEA